MLNRQAKMSKARCCLPFCYLVSFDKSSTLVPPALAKGEFVHDKRGVWSSGRSDRSIDWGQDGPLAQPVPPPPNKRWAEAIPPKARGAFILRRCRYCWESAAADWNREGCLHSLGCVCVRI